eukprot:scaffold90288_cov52-Attheya_sp.AAC.4
MGGRRGATSKSSTGKLFGCVAPTGGLTSPLLLVRLKMPPPSSIANDISQQDHRCAQQCVVELSSYRYDTSRVAQSIGGSSTKL